MLVWQTNEKRLGGNKRVKQIANINSKAIETVERIFFCCPLPNIQL